MLSDLRKICHSICVRILLQSVIIKMELFDFGVNKKERDTKNETGAAEKKGRDNILFNICSGTWDATAFPSGVYFARLEMEEHSESIKMVLLK